MKSIYDSLKEGNARERLALVSDVVTIMGVSLAVIFTPLLRASDLRSAQRALDYIMLGAGFFFLLFLITGIALFLDSLIKTQLPKLFRVIFGGMICMAWIGAVCLAIAITLNSLPR